MKKLILIALGVVCVAFLVGFASISRKSIPVFTPDGAKHRVTTKNTDATDYSAYGVVRVECYSTAYRRHTPSSAKGSYGAIKVTADSPLTFGISEQTPFMILSGSRCSVEGM